MRLWWLRRRLWWARRRLEHLQYVAEQRGDMIAAAWARQALDRTEMNR